MKKYKKLKLKFYSVKVRKINNELTEISLLRNLVQKEMNKRNKKIFYETH